MIFFHSKLKSNYAGDKVLCAFRSNLSENKTHGSEDLTKNFWMTYRKPYDSQSWYMSLDVSKDTVNDILKCCDDELEASKFETVWVIDIVHHSCIKTAKNWMLFREQLIS